MESPNGNCQQAFGDYKLSLTPTEALLPNPTLNSSKLNNQEKLVKICKTAIDKAPEIL